MSKAKEKKFPPEKLVQYERLVATIPGLERKGDTVPYTSMNGNMSSYLHESGLVALRLPSTEREKFLETYQTKLFEAYGIVQKEYVTVPESLLENTEELAPFFKMSVDYVQSLRPKPTKRAAKNS
jgi:hypothetical protein